MQNYPLLNLFLTMLWLFLWVIWIFLLIRVFSDVFRSADLNGWKKAAWILVLLVLPYLGVLIYLIVRGGQMHTREARQARANEEAVREYIRESVGTSTTSVAGDLERLAALRDSGVLTPEEFAAQKAKILA